MIRRPCLFSTLSPLPFVSSLSLSFYSIFLSPTLSLPTFFLHPRLPTLSFSLSFFHFLSPLLFLSPSLRHFDLPYFPIFSLSVSYCLFVISFPLLLFPSLFTFFSIIVLPPSSFSLLYLLFFSFRCIYLLSFYFSVLFTPSISSWFENSDNGILG